MMRALYQTVKNNLSITKPYSVRSRKPNEHDTNLPIHTSSRLRFLVLIHGVVFLLLLFFFCNFFLFQKQITKVPEKQTSYNVIPVG